MRGLVVPATVSANSVGLAKQLQALELIDQDLSPISRDIIRDLLLRCIKGKDLPAGRRLHFIMISTGLDAIPYLGDYLIRMFASCGSLLEANSVFCKTSKPSVYTWNAIISAYAKLGEGGKAMELYHKMLQTSIAPDKVTFLCIMKACSSMAAVEQGKEIHDQIIKSGLEANVVIGSTLVDLYAKCGSLQEARLVFDKLSYRTVVSWGAMIAGYAEHGHCLSTLELFDEMQLEGVKPDKLIFSFILKACGSIGAIEKGRLIHGQLIYSGSVLDVVVGNTLVDMYAKWGYLEDACQVLTELPDQTVVSWCAMIAGYVQHGYGHLAIKVFEKMQQEGFEPDKIAFLCILKACGNIGDIRKGRLLHCWIIKIGLQSDTVVGSTLVDMYAKCGSLEEACKVFDELQNRTVVSWSVLILGYAETGCGFPALELFKQMQEEGIEPDEVTFLCTLKACGSLGGIRQGRMIHGQIIKRELQSDIIGNSLVDMYAKCGSMEEAQQVFDSLLEQTVVSWGTMIAGYAEHGQSLHALVLFKKMQEKGVMPSKVTFLCVLKACGTSQSTEQAHLLHKQIVASGYESDLIVGSTLVDIYAKAGSLEEAQKVFDNLPSQNVVSWGAMTTGYVQRGHGVAALGLFEKMLQKGLQPSRVMFLCSLQACGSIGAVKRGRLIHGQIVRSGLKSDVIVGNALVDMYVKFGNLEEASTVFKGMLDRDVISWGAIIAGYTWYGNWMMASEFLEKMLQQGFIPNHVIFTSILAACSHAGLLEEGCWYFTCIREFGSLPNIEHYSCMVDLFGRAGHLKEAEDLLRSMPERPDFVMWMSLLTSCGTYGNIGLGSQCFAQLHGLNFGEASGYILMSKIYAAGHMWKYVDNIEERRKFAGAQKKPGRAWLEVENMVPEFIVGVKDHPQCNEIEAKLNRVSRKMEEEGLVPFLDLVLDPMVDGNEEDAFCGSCEEFGVAFGLLSTSPCATLRVANYVCMYKDFLNSVNSESTMKNREVILKDAFCIHVFSG